MHIYDVNKLYSQNNLYQHTRMMLIYYDAIKIVIYKYAIDMFTKYACKLFAKLYCLNKCRTFVHNLTLIYLN